jgi:hypothetical protein
MIIITFSRFLILQYRNPDCTQQHNTHADHYNASSQVNHRTEIKLTVQSIRCKISNSTTMDAALIAVSIPSVQQGIKRKRSVDSFMGNERPAKKIKVSGVFLEAFIAGFAVRVKNRADDIDMHQQRVHIVLAERLIPPVDPGSRLLKRPQLTPSEFGLTEEKIERLTRKLSQITAPTSAPVQDPFREVNVPESALAIRRSARNVPRLEYNVKKAFKELAKQAKGVPKPQVTKATQKIAGKVAPILVPANLSTQSKTIAVTVTPDWPVPAKVGPVYSKKLTENTAKKISKSAPKRPRATAPVRIKPTCLLSTRVVKYPATFITDDVAYERLRHEAALGLTKLWWPEPTESAVRDTPTDAELINANNIASVLLQVQHDGVEKLSDASAQDVHTTEVAPVSQVLLPNSNAVPAPLPKTKAQTGSRRLTRKKGRSLPEVSLQPPPLRLDTAEGFMPSVTTDFKFKYDSPSGRTASELDTLLTLPKFGTMNKASSIMPTTHRRLQDRPKAGVAERLVKEMEEGHGKLIDKFEEDLESGLVEQVQRPYDQEDVADCIKFCEVAQKGLD